MMTGIRDSENDGSLSKTKARRLKQWQDGDLDGLYNKGAANALVEKEVEKNLKLKHKSSTN